MNFIIIPAKPLEQSKSRLAPVLTPGQRVELSKTLLERTIAVAGQFGPVVVVSRDHAVRRLAKKAGAWALVESGVGLNAAVRQATEWVTARGGVSTLILPADLPYLTEANIEEIIRLGQEPPCVVVAPCHRGSGTNALFLSPVSLPIEFAFGQDSFARHQQAAREAGLSPIIYHSSSLAFDLDLPEDWMAFKNASSITEIKNYSF